MSKRTAQEILDSQAELRLRFEEGLDQIDFEELRQPKFLDVPRPVDPLVDRVIEI